MTFDLCSFVHKRLDYYKNILDRNGFVELFELMKYVGSKEESAEVEELFRRWLEIETRSKYNLDDLRKEVGKWFPNLKEVGDGQPVGGVLPKRRTR